MTAQPVSGGEPTVDDPAEILRRLPSQYHEEFRREYASAVEQAREPEGFRGLARLLRLWGLRAAAYSAPGYAERLAEATAGHTSSDVAAGHVMSRPGRSPRPRG